MPVNEGGIQVFLREVAGARLPTAKRSRTIPPDRIADGNGQHGRCASLPKREAPSSELRFRTRTVLPTGGLANGLRRERPPPAGNWRGRDGCGQRRGGTSQV